MKRMLAVAAALLILPFALGMQTDQANDPPFSEQVTSSEEINRSESISRATRPAAFAKLTTVVRSGDTYGRWAVKYCGNFGAWLGIQRVNGWPERRIPLGATASIVCSGSSAPPASASSGQSTATWVHPLKSGAKGTSCYHTSRRPGHDGVDISAPKGTPIRAVAAGKVYRKANNPDGAGYYVTLKHANNVYTQYHHLRAPSPLGVGASVVPGQTIGYVGITGNSTGYHLHFEVMRGGYGSNYHTSPGPFMRARSVNVGC